MSRIESAADIRLRDEAVTTPAIYRFTDIVLERGEGAFVWDSEGRRYYDLAAGIATLNLGHCHPRVIEAISHQASRLIHGAAHIGYMRPYVELLEFLRSIAPAPLDEGMGFFMNSGSEAVESAIKLARMVTGRPTIISFVGGFHGRSMGALGATASSASYRRGLSGLLSGVVHVPYPTCAHCPFGHLDRSPDRCCNMTLPSIDAVLDKLVHPDDVAAIIVEPLMGEGGYFVPPGDFLPQLKTVCERIGALLIVDEVQTGLGRTGRWFGFEHSGVVPDVIALGKAIGGGLPLGAVFGRREILRAWAPGAHGSTFGGNPVSCASGLATLRVIQEDKLLGRATQLGDRIRSRVGERAPANVSDVRGLGAMLALEITDDGGQVISPAAASALVRAIGHAGVITTKCGQQLVRIAPPLVLSDSDADAAMDILLDVVASQPVAAGAA